LRRATRPLRVDILTGLTGVKLEQKNWDRNVKISVNRRSGSNRAKGDCKLLRRRVNVVDPVGVGFDFLEITNATLL